MKTIFLNIILSILLLSSCSHSIEEPTDNLLSSESDQTLKAVIISDFEKWSIDDPKEFIKHNNLVATINHTRHHNLSVVNLALNKRLDPISRSTDNSDGAYTSALDASSGKEITYLNFRTGQLYVTPINHSEPSNTFAVQLPFHQQHLIAAKTEHFIISTGLYEQGRYLFYSLEDSSAHYYLSYPEHPRYPELSQYAKSMLYASNVLRIRPDARAFVCTDIRSGILDICRITNHRIERIKQHSFYYPKIYVHGNATDTINILYDRSTVLGFQDIAVSNNRIYVLYSGKSLSKDRYNMNHCQTLLTFDWDGNQLATQKLDVPTTNITYDKTENALYGVGYTPGATLIKYNL